MFEDEFCSPVVNPAGYRDLKETYAAIDNVISLEGLAERHRKLFERGQYASDRGGSVIQLASRRMAIRGAKFI